MSTRAIPAITKRGKPVPVQQEREREEEILAPLRGKAVVLVSEKAFLKPLAGAAGWKPVRER